MGAVTGPRLKDNKKWFAVLAIVLVLLGIVTIFFTYDGIAKDIQSSNWPTTEGEILSSTITEERTHGRDTMNKYTYGVDITYKYTVDNQSYTSDKISFGMDGVSTSDQNYAQDLVDKYTEGKKVTVYYNPDKPSEALLEPGLNLLSTLPFIFGIAVLIGGFLIIYFVYFRKRFVGSIKISLEKKDFSPGEIIRGNLYLDLKKPITAESLNVKFRAEKKIRVRSYGSSGFRSRQETLVVFQDKKIIDGSRTYQNEKYSFELKIPEDILDKMENWGEDGVAYYGDKKVEYGEKVAAIQNFSKNLAKYASGGRAYDVFLVEGHLDVKRKIDVKDYEEIIIKK